MKKIYILMTSQIKITLTKKSIFSIDIDIWLKSLSECVDNYNGPNFEFFIRNNIIHNNETLILHTTTDLYPILVKIDYDNKAYFKFTGNEQSQINEKELEELEFMEYIENTFHISHGHLMSNLLIYGSEEYLEDVYSGLYRQHLDKIISVLRVYIDSMNSLSLNYLGDRIRFKISCSNLDEPVITLIKETFPGTFIFEYGECNYEDMIEEE
jgi:hypothetical protein